MTLAARASQASTAGRVLSTADVQASEVKVSFDPSYQSLAFHEIRLWRGGRNVRTFSRADVTVVHEESYLSEGIYNGSLSAIAFRSMVDPKVVYRQQGSCSAQRRRKPSRSNGITHS